MAGPSMEEMNKSTHEMREHIKQMSGSAHQVSESFTSVLRSVIGANAVIHLFDPVVKMVRGYFENIVRSATASRAQVDAEYLARVREIRELRIRGDITRDEAQRRQLALIAEQPYYRLRAQAGDAFAGSSRLAMGYLGLAALATAKLVHDTTELNRALIGANSSFAERNRLTRANLDTMISTGQSFGDVLQAQQSLLELGYKNSSNYDKTLETVVLLHKGLGVSVENAAQLAVVVERQVRGSFVDVSNVLANIVNQTSLVADEATRMTKELGTLLSMVAGQGAGSMLPEMTKAVAKYEDALKRITGTSGAVTSLIRRAASPEGFGMAGALGVYSPDMLATKQGIDTLMQNFRNLGDSLVGESTGWQRRMGLDALAKMMGMSAEEVNGLYLSVRNANVAITDEMSLRDRFRQQTRDLSSTLSQLGNRLLALLERGMYPFVVVINALASGLNSLLDVLGTFEPLVDTISIMATLAVPVAILALRGLIAQIYKLAASSIATRLGMGGGFSGQGLLQLGRGALGLVTPLSAILAVLTATGLTIKHIYDINKDTRDKAREADWRHTAGLMDLAKRQRENITFNARYGHFEGIGTKIKSYLTDVGGALAKEGLSGEAYASRLRQAARDLRNDVDRAAYTSTQFSGSKLTPQQQAMLDQQMGVEDAVTQSGEAMAKSYKEVGHRNQQMIREQQHDMNLKWYQTMALDLTYGLRHPINMLTGHATEEDTLRVK